ncbi:membrane protein [Rhizocola hellebori]|uniref:Membrane protein n=1 Tax=Rhizocola hellebori TaxID=1392758 RepID=A0A8J3Q1S1_9ACTN|nr:VWA domain-containing protein [Rhizocola hellebori]GIH02026.1 membrane protein [Rhizocola hellebori]
MIFLDSNRLWLLLTLAALAAAYVVLQLRRRHYAIRFTNLRLLENLAPARPGWRRHVPAVLFLALMAIMVIAFARPQAREQVPRERATVIIAIDVSGSMMATDVVPNRLYAATEAGLDFVDSLRPTFNVGLIAFAGNASVVVAPGTDRTTLKLALERLDDREVTQQGTAIGEAIAAALETIETLDARAAEDPPPARIIVLSDGANTAGRSPEQAAEEAFAASVPVDSIAFGTPNGIVYRGERAVRVPVDGETLQRVAAQTGGTYHEAVTTDELREVYSAISSSIGYKMELRDVSARVVGYGLIIALLVAAASLAWFSRLP